MKHIFLVEDDLSLIPISAKVHRRQNRMTLLCIIIAVFLVTAIFSMGRLAYCPAEHSGKGGRSDPAKI